MKQYSLKYSFLTLCILCCCLMLFQSCVTTRQINYLQDIAAKYPIDTTQNEDYHIQCRDLLYIRVFSLDETIGKIFNSNQLNSASNAGMLYSYHVYEDGTIDLPFASPIKIQGKTLREAKNIIEAELNKLSTSDISVNISVLNRTFSIVGESGCGRYTMPKERINIFQALALSGDLTTYSDRKHLKILRRIDNGETKIFDVDVRSKDIINSEFYYILPNDVIYVPYLTEKTFGITHATGILSTTLSTISFVATIVNLVILMKDR